MKIKQVVSYCNQNVGLVRVTMEDGSHGWGQVSTYHADISCLVLHRQVAPHVLGMAVENQQDIARLAELVCEKEHKFPGSHLYRAICGVETALWDWLGKQQNKTVCELLGGKPRPLRVYASSMKRDITPHDEARRFQKLQEKHGYDAFKFRVGAEFGHNADEWPGRTEEIIPAIRNALDSNTTLLADANSCYTPDKAIEVGKLLQDNGVVHFEEPCPYWNMEWTKQVTDALDIDVTGGEQDNYLPAWQRMAEKGIVNVLQPDICYMGGISRTLQVVDVAQKAGLPVTPHSANLSLVTIFTLHLMGAIENAGPYVEFSIEEADYYPWQYDIYDTFPVAVDGRVAIPDAPGWGVEIKNSWLEKADRQISES